MYRETRLKRTEKKEAGRWKGGKREEIGCRKEKQKRGRRKWERKKRIWACRSDGRIGVGGSGSGREGSAHDGGPRGCGRDGTRGPDPSARPRPVPTAPLHLQPAHLPEDICAAPGHIAPPRFRRGERTKAAKVSLRLIAFALPRH